MILLRRKSLPCFWCLLSAWGRCPVTPALSHGRGVSCAPGWGHSSHLCFPGGLSMNISLLERPAGSQGKNTEVAMSGRDGVALGEVSGSHIRPEFVVILVFEASQSFSSHSNAPTTFNADRILKDSVPKSWIPTCTARTLKPKYQGTNHVLVAIVTEVTTKTYNSLCMSRKWEAEEMHFWKSSARSLCPERSAVKENKERAAHSTLRSILLQTSSRVACLWWMWHFRYHWPDTKENTSPSLLGRPLRFVAFLPFPWGQAITRPFRVSLLGKRCFRFLWWWRKWSVLKI